MSTKEIQQGRHPGVDFRLPFPVSCMTLLVFCEEDGESCKAIPADLAHLSMVSLPVDRRLMLVGYPLFWRWAGLALCAMAAFQRHRIVAGKKSV